MVKKIHPFYQRKRLGNKRINNRTDTDYFLQFGCADCLTTRQLVHGNRKKSISTTLCMKYFLSNVPVVQPPVRPSEDDLPEPSSEDE